MTSPYKSSSSGAGEGGGFLVFGDFAFEEVLFLFEVHGLGEPGEGVFDSALEGLEAAVDEAAVGDVVDVLFEFFAAETYGADGEAVADEFFFRGGTPSFMVSRRSCWNSLVPDVGVSR